MNDNSINTTNSPIFCVGHPRSGSTLLTSYLGKHRNIKSIPETHIYDYSFSPLWLYKFLSMISQKLCIKNLFNRNFRLLDVFSSLDDFVNTSEWANCRERRSIVSNVFDAVLIGTGKSRVCEKTPQHLAHVDRILEDFPCGKIICIIRDGRDAIPSLMNVSWTHSDEKRHANEWRWAVSKAIKYRKKYPENFFIVRFEDFIANTDETLMEICDFIQETYYPEDFEKESSSSAIPDWENKWKSWASSFADRRKVKVWSKLPEKTVLTYEKLLMPEIKLIGYDLECRDRRRLPYTLKMIDLILIDGKYILQNQLLGRRQGFNFSRRHEGGM